jgi:hypothetical protein
MKNKFTGTIIGLIFSLSSLVATWTFIIPFITVLPLSLFLENTFTNGSNDGSYSDIGPSILKAMWIIFIISLALYYIFAIIKVKLAKPVTKLSFILFLTGQLFIVHPLLFYIDTSQNWDRASDGQFIFGITETFPTSSFSFVVFGILLDLIRHMVKPKQNANSISADT